MTLGATGHWLGQRWPCLVGLLALLGKLWLVDAHDLMVTITPHDDLLFVNQAAALLRGDWLGPYNQLTLIKGPFYPMFIALAYWLDLPLLLAQQLLYAAACAVTALALTPLLRRSWLVALYLLLLLHPVSSTYPAMGRVLQSGIYPALGLLCLALALGLALRAADCRRRPLPWALGLGLATGLLWITRDESVWIVPPLVLILLWSFSHALASGLTRSRAVVLHLSPLVVGSGVVLLLCGVNAFRYGIFVHNELQSSGFKAAYGGLLRIRSDKEQRHYPVVREARRQAYAVSPSLREIEALLDGEIGERWQGLCGSADVIGDTVRSGGGCSDLPAAFFIWALRDAVTTAGHHRDARETQDYYRRIGTEIDQACAAGQLDCRPRYTSLIPPWRSEYTRLAWPTFWQLLQQILRIESFAATTEGWLSRGDTRQVRLVEAVTGERLLSSRRDMLALVPDFARQLDREKTRILEDAGHVYQRLQPPLVWGALAILVVLTVMDLRRWRPAPLVAGAWAVLCGVVVLTSILTLVQLTSYTSVGRPMQTALPLVTLFVCLVVLDGLRRCLPVARPCE